MALVVKKLPANAGDKRDAGSISGLGGLPGEGHGNPLQYSCLEGPMDRGAWRATVHGVARVGHNLATKRPLYNIVVVFAIQRHESATGAHVSPHPEPPSHLPPHPIPLGCPRAPALSALLHRTCTGHLQINF